MSVTRVITVMRMIGTYSPASLDMPENTPSARFVMPLSAKFRFPTHEERSHDELLVSHPSTETKKSQFEPVHRDTCNINSGSVRSHKDIKIP